MHSQLGYYQAGLFRFQLEECQQELEHTKEQDGNWLSYLHNHPRESEYTNIRFQAEEWHREDQSSLSTAPPQPSWQDAGDPGS